MIKFAKIIDSESGLCDVGIGTNNVYYSSLGMTELDVKEGFDGKWYLKEKINTDEYKAKYMQHNIAEFQKCFFETSKGWIRRKVKMAEGESKDFLSDILLQIKAGLEVGGNVNIITYKTPDYSKELNEEYLISLQEIKKADLDFVKECLNRTLQDWQG